MRTFIQTKIDQIKSFAQENAYLKKVFATLCILYGIGFSAIIRANFLYKDDMVRNYFGGRYWLGWSRYGSDILSILFHADKTLSDISPLTQILAILALALASTILIHIFYEKKNFSFLSCFAVLPLGLFPYFLECISYKFDAPYMAASILAAVFPLLFCEYKDRKTLIGYGIVCVFCGIFICSSYQVSLGIFPMTILFLSARRIQKGEKLKKSLKFVGISAAFYLVGIVIFRLFLMKKPVDDGYTTNIVLPLQNLFSGGISSLKMYYGLMWEDLKSGWKILMALILLCYLTLFTLKSQINKAGAFFVAVLVLLLCAVLSFPYIIFEKPLHAPRAMYGFGAFLALVAIQGCNLTRTSITKILAFCLSWCFFSFALEYGNALYQLKQWKEFRVCLVVSDLNQIVQDENTYVLQVSGSMGRVPSIAKKKQHSNILNNLVPVAEDTPGLAFYIRYLFGLQTSFTQDNSVDLRTLDLPVLKETTYHTIRGDNEHILVLLK